MTVLIEEQNISTSIIDDSIGINVEEQNITVQINETPVYVTTVDDAVSVNIIEEDLVIHIDALGPQGPSGIDGIAGPQGYMGVNDVSYTHNQDVSASTWVINHNLDFQPNITIVDSAGTVVEGDYTYTNSTTVIAEFNGGFAGKAYLS